jgi:hypothetical protein
MSYFHMWTMASAMSLRLARVIEDMEQSNALLNCSRKRVGVVVGSEQDPGHRTWIYGCGGGGSGDSGGDSNNLGLTY